METTNEAERYFIDQLLPPVQSYISKIKILNGDVKTNIKRLLGLSTKYDQIVDFGSGSGWRTLLLAFGLGSKEIIGIDKKIDAVERADREINSEFLNNMFREIAELKEMYELPNVRKKLSQETHSIVGEIISRFQFRPTFRFILGDLTRGVSIPELPSNYFDLAHSRRCLYQIYCEDPIRPSDVEAAITEMSRVVKPGGLLAAHEQDRCPGIKEPCFDMKEIFIRQSGLSLLHSSVENEICVVIARKL